MPQLENGYTRIADEILENIAKLKLNGTQMRILLIVWRCTYGWQKKEHEMSLTYLARATGIHKQQIKKELDKLIEMNIISVIVQHTDTVARVLSFNKNYLSYVIEVQSANKSTVSELAYPTVSEKAYPTVSELAYQNKELKDNNKDICILPSNQSKKSEAFDYKGIYDYYLSLDLVNHKTYTKEMTKAIKHAKDNLSIDEEEMKRMLKRHSQKVIDSKGNGQFKTKKRTLTEFFGQKKVNSIQLICSDYLDENYEEAKPIVKINSDEMKTVII